MPEGRIHFLSLTVSLTRQSHNFPPQFSPALQDEETRSVHLPIIFSALMETLLVSFDSFDFALLTLFRFMSRRIRLVLSHLWCGSVLYFRMNYQDISPEALQQRPRLPDSSREPMFGSLAFGLGFYGIEVSNAFGFRYQAVVVVCIQSNLCAGRGSTTGC